MTAADTRPDGPDLVKVAVRAAQAAGAAIRRLSVRPTGVAFKSTPTDPVTDADRAAESAVVELLAAERPQDGILAEEGTLRQSTTGLRWVVDPLDGTVNFLYQLPHYAVSIACEQAAGDSWRPVAGVVHDVLRDETFSAARGGGARLNETAISVNDPVDPESALVATGFAYSDASRTRQASMVAGLLPRIRDIRSTGSCALDMCWTAAGRNDGFYEDELARWDWSAGSLIVREAGGTVSPLRRGLIAAGPALHTFLRRALR
jgi:myo-inositol-1(or 4)-monophosphatase